MVYCRARSKPLLLRNRLKRKRFAADANQKTIATSAMSWKICEKLSPIAGFRLPRDGQPAEIQPEHHKAEERDEAEACRQDGDKTFVQPQAAELAPHEAALQKRRKKQTRHHASDKGRDARGRNLPAQKVKDGLRRTTENFLIRAYTPPHSVRTAARG